MLNVSRNLLRTQADATTSFFSAVFENSYLCASSSSENAIYSYSCVQGAVRCKSASNARVSRAECNSAFNFSVPIETSASEIFRWLLRHMICTVFLSSLLNPLSLKMERKKLFEIFYTVFGKLKRLLNLIHERAREQTECKSIYCTCSASRTEDLFAMKK